MVVARTLALALVLAGCSPTAERLDRCANDNAPSSETMAFHDLVVQAERTLIRIGDLPQPTRAGYLALDDSIQSGGTTWTEFCTAFRDDGGVCGDLTYPPSFGVYPYSLSKIRNAPPATKTKSPGLDEAVRRLSDEEFADPSFRASVTAAAIGDLFGIYGPGGPLEPEGSTSEL